MLKKIKDFFRERNDVTKGMQEPTEEMKAYLKPLPIDMSPSREAYEKLGFCFYKWTYKGAGEKWGEVATDQVRCLAKLPEGWKINGLDALHAEILDENGKRRVEFFFKQEPWDIRGYMYML